MDVLSLDLETIVAINERLRQLSEEIPVEQIHGSLKLEIVKGKFQRLEVTSSYLLNDRQKRQKTA